MIFDNAKTLIDYIVNSDYTTTEWEDGFIESILVRGKDLTPKQNEVLTKIYEKSNGGGQHQRKQYL